MTDYNTFYDYALSLGCNVLKDEPMKKHITFKLGGNAKIFVEPESEEQLVNILKKCNELSLHRVLIGNGSNLIVSDEGIDGVVIHLGEKFGKIELISDTELFVQAGANLMRVCKFALNNSLSGLEFAYGIPGSAGGAAFMNAGAYGGEMKDVLYKCACIDTELNKTYLSGNELDLSYRHSAFCDNGYIITGLYLKLKKGNADEIKAQMEELMARRKDKQPLDYPSAGSTFKRPEGYFAAKLIDDCGLRGKSVGGAQVSQKHAGFVINKGGATCADVLGLCEIVKSKVKSKFGVELEREIKIIN